MPTVTSCRVNDKVLSVEFDPKTFVPIGEHAIEFKSYLGTLARFHENWVIPDDERIKKKILSQIAKCWRDFKTTMTHKFVFASKQNEIPVQGIKYLMRRGCSLKNLDLVLNGRYVL
ncbi:hypothetical protein V8G54_034054 [Vigna mungo]|uniref:Uncharacterized protein n=1 Tax=Vigna mungo TaxID=3915 RepID=A0AAQ3MPF4_VIGMU